MRKIQLLVTTPAIYQLFSENSLLFCIFHFSVMFDLMTDLLYQLRLQGDARLATAFRRAETIVDKILSNWLTFLLYKFIKVSNYYTNSFLKIFYMIDCI